MRQWRAGQRSASGQYHVQLFKRVTCKRVCTCAWLARRARMVRCTHGACVTSMLCARVLVCKAQSSERGRGSGEAQHASFRFRFFLLRSKNREACIYAALDFFLLLCDQPPFGRNEIVHSRRSGPCTR